MSDIEKLKKLKKLDAGAPDIVKTYHKSSYAAISPLRPELSQAGKTVLITGASAGIGSAIARAYAEASASKVILTGRRKDVVQNSASKPSDEFKNTKFDARVCDVGNVAESAALWSSLCADGVFVDVLVLSAAKFGGQESILDAGVANIWSEYETNVRSPLQFTEQLYKQEGHKDRQKHLVYVSTAAIHSKPIAASLPSYSLSKTSGHLVLQKIAGEVDQKKLQIVSFHPGAILSETSRNAGLDETTLPWDDDNLPGHFAVWAASSEAAFLHGRFAWAAWDVNEMQSGEVKKRIETDADFLTIDLVGGL
ncbi:related to peroxisomal short-chain alcohol dehydrogenase [Phialocephala subalpina]|uniref:Related to peroxisomal short-chain alcohol dehydrogenase n=1 Tax=Phialocephala subalpina TaxID=576137 RepID=A0A1L7XMA1_9HELO|nr:related to peroxisomal short-chain alcohol dehydrogenase [Phialocephala subalpina]